MINDFKVCCSYFLIKKVHFLIENDKLDNVQDV